MKHRHLIMLALLTTALPGPALAGARQDVQAGMARCAVFADDRQYLDCLYGAAQPLRAQLGLLPAPAGQVRLVPPAAMAVRRLPRPCRRHRLRRPRRRAASWPI